MSSLLEQAIVDAKALKEAALKNAEATIIDKYSAEVKSTLNQLLEQDELGDLEDMMSGAEETMEEEVATDEIAEGVPDAFTEDVAELDGVTEGDEATVTVDFAELAEALKSLREEVEGEDTLEEAGCPDDGDGDEPIPVVEEAEENLDEEIELDEDAIMEMVASILSEEEATLADDTEAGEAAAADADATQMKDAGLEEAEESEEVVEEIEISDSLLDAIMEKLTVDMGESLVGWAGRSSEDTKYQMEKELARRRSTDMEEELDALKQAQEELVFENKKLKETLVNYKSVVGSLKENVQDVNLSNARLLYTNRVLGNTSLNERQKQRIVEAISKAGSVEEAKTIHETLQSAVQSGPRTSPKSLNEAITRPSSIIRASRKEEPKADPFTARMRKLAGI